MLNIKIHLRGMHCVVDNEFHALYRLKQMKILLKTKENTLNLAIVIDCSGSMQGKPLQEAKRSAMMMVDLMQSTEGCLIAYDSSVKLFLQQC